MEVSCRIAREEEPFENICEASELGENEVAWQRGAKSGREVSLLRGTLFVPRFPRISWAFILGSG